jgi:hypothetical protein
MCPVWGGQGKTGHIKKRYVPGLGRTGKNRSHKEMICAALREERTKPVT